jgi:hypothetical protein
MDPFTSTTLWMRKSPVFPAAPAASTARASDATPFAISKVQTLTAADRKALARGDKARLKVTVSRPGTVTVAGKAMIGQRKQKVVDASAKAKAAGTVAVPIGLSKAALAELDKEGSLAITLRVGFGDANPKAVHLTLKAVAKKKGGRS